jgi:L-lactate dehydrogenase complex protein LldG
MVEEPPMNARERILARIREALTVPAPKPGSHGHVHVHGSHPPHAGSQDAQPIGFRSRPVHEARAWLPQGGSTPAEHLARFAAASSELKTDFRCVDSEAEAHAALRRIADDEGWRRVASHHHALTDAAVAALGRPALFTDGGYPPDDLEACEAGITTCDVLVAQTGSLVVNSRTSGGRALSVLPPHHVVLARRDQLVSDLTDAFERVEALHGRQWPSMISLVTGPSRTGDIERILVLGAHGPKKLTVLMW